MRTGLLAWLLGASILFAAQNPSSNDPGVKANGIVRGQVLLPNGRPAQRAAVRMLPPTGGVPRTVTADLVGRYEFTDVQAGDYRISAGKPGYLALEYGQQRAFEYGKVVAVGAGQTVEHIDITLPASGAISGQVVDANGDPVEAIVLRLMQVQFGANRRQLLPVGGVGARTTDDRGEYRFYGVPPGQYVVLASVADQPRARAPIILPPGYATTYYPGTASAAQAKLVTVGLSQDVPRIDFSLARVPTVRISGIVVDSQGKPLQARVLLSTSQRSGAIVVAEPLTVASGQDGTFQLRNVPAGDWVLQATAGNNVNDGREGEFTSQFVTVNGGDIGGVRLQTSAGSHVEGRVVFDGLGPPDPTGVTITTLPSDFDRGPLIGPSGRATVKPDGTFALDGLSGPRRFRLLRAPSSWSLETIHLNGRDVTDEPVSFGRADESVTDLEIVLTNRAASLKGSVLDARGQPVTDYTAIVFATDAGRWYQASRFLSFTRPNADGTFVVVDLPPGEYFVAAVDRMQGTTGFGEWQDPDVLKSLEASASKVLVAEGQVLSLTPRLIVR